MGDVTKYIRFQKNFVIPNFGQNPEKMNFGDHYFQKPAGVSEKNLISQILGIREPVSQAPILFALRTRHLFLLLISLFIGNFLMLPTSRIPKPRYLHHDGGRHG